MKLALIYDSLERKLQDNHYSQTYLEQFNALRYGFDTVQLITEDCDAKDIDADVIIFYDIHSSHHIKIDGIEKHPALKYEYFDDPHQLRTKGVWRDSGRKFLKLGPADRMLRAKDRRIDFIICPYKEQYYRYLAPYQWKNDLLFWQPICVNPDLFCQRWKAWNNRINDIILTGSLQCQNEMYDFRKWLTNKEIVNLTNWQAPKGKAFPNFLCGYKGAIAASTFPVPKYIEVAMAGCIPFMQWNIDAYEMGFRHGKTCIYIDKTNFDYYLKKFTENPNQFRYIAEQSQLWAETEFTIKNFIENIQEHAWRNRRSKNEI